MKIFSYKNIVKPIISNKNGNVGKAYEYSDVISPSVYNWHPVVNM